MTDSPSPCHEDPYANSATYTNTITVLTPTPSNAFASITPRLPTPPSRLITPTILASTEGKNNPIHQGING
ncbi:hypothetical protein E2C01_083839 [Portunus trituberculatus]|uniref:Uncharacterized protein n=1 Tax=Portunus trituberculatus TaxID=210409 RepID=A0A5B7J2D3_PORTR|nr:hypothetical protein [Portunus trituberculatus]